MKVKSTQFKGYFVSKGYLNCLKYAHNNGCKWNSNACASAALNGHFFCLKYAHENGCSWDEYTCSYAAKNGHLEGGRRAKGLSFSGESGRSDLHSSSLYHAQGGP
jgi:hypothetical protein